MLIITQTALELGFLYAPVALALFLSYRILDIADLTTDGCFVLGAAVSVSLTADKAFATVRVQDTGCGMRAEVGTHIFEKFYQGDTSHATQGNGLGLALVKRVVDILKGEISVESTVGVGSTFTVKIRRT